MGAGLAAVPDRTAPAGRQAPGGGWPVSNLPFLTSGHRVLPQTLRQHRRSFCCDITLFVSGCTTVLRSHVNDHPASQDGKHATVCWSKLHVAVRNPLFTQPGVLKGLQGSNWGWQESGNGVEWRDLRSERGFHPSAIAGSAAGTYQMLHHQYTIQQGSRTP